MSQISDALQPESDPLKSKEMKKVFFFHFGCRVNQIETLNMENSSSLSNSNTTFETADSVEQADYVVINTCTVTNRADVKNRGAIRRVQKINPNAKIIVTGCYATTDREDIENMDGVYLVVSNAEKNAIPELISNIETGVKDTQVKPVQETIFKSYPQSLEKLSRAYLKIQDGCDKRCSYCKIPMARGKAVSRNFESIQREVNTLQEANFSEMILTGINIGRYKTEKVQNFSNLLTKLVNMPGQFYYRISSLEPESLTPEIIELVNHDKVAPFFHIPLQSASPRILELMNRRYDPEEVKQKFAALRELHPGVHIGTDIIVGFPGETEENFLETLCFVQNLNFANIHIFPWSRRSQTSLDRKLENGELKMVHGAVIRERVERLKKAADLSVQEYIQKTAGMVFRAIVESTGGTTINVTTENYMKCTLPAKLNLDKGQLIRMKYDKELNGELISNE